MIAKIGEWVKQHRRDLWTGLCLALVAWSAYNVGTVRGRNTPLGTPLEGSISAQATPFYRSSAVDQKPAKTPDKSDTRVAASKSGTKYYYSWCAGIKRIKDANKVWFDTAAAAEAKGYALAANCQP